MQKLPMGKFYAPPPINYEATSTNIDQKISPSILLIIIILAIIFSISALLHLLLRYFSLKRTTQNNQQDEHGDDVTALQGQLRQLFHLHDAGVDQLYIDTLPVFPYKAIIGVKDPFDCAVCLCEFELNDKLRLLPKCSHAFHMECIDTWLLSHSTCPLCRLNIVANLNEFESVGCRNLPPFVCVLESGSVENSREIRQEMITSGGNDQFGSGHFEFGRKSVENRGHHEEKNNNNNVVVIKLGKFKNLDGDQNVEPSEDNYSTNNDGQNGENELGHDSRRCYSMGSFAYVLDEKTSLQVPVNTLMKKQVSKRTIHRVAMSEYGFDFDGTTSFQNGNEGNNKKESYSMSKIWQRNGNKKEINNECSSTRTISEIQVEIDEDIQSCYSIDSVSNQNVGSTSTHRRTLAWLMGKPNKVFHNHSSSLSSNV